MYGQLIQLLVNAVTRAFSNPGVQHATIRFVTQNDANPVKMGRQLKREWDDIAEGTASLFGYVSESAYKLRLKITNGRREAEAILEASRSIKNYHASNVSNSQIIQGEHIVNNLTISIHLSVPDNDRLMRLVSRLRPLESQVPEVPKEPSDTTEDSLKLLSEQIEQVDHEASPLMHQLMELMARATDYEKLKVALGTAQE